MLECRQGSLAAVLVACGQIEEQGPAGVQGGGGVLERDAADCVDAQRRMSAFGQIIGGREERRGEGGRLRADGEADAPVGACDGGDALEGHVRRMSALDIV